ncbi:hypothetical protein AnigIFM50267_011357 [Aspergillus niger]|nr:hypothetical protein AnigIFM50267_011357 [Aspergillus niger]
MGEGLNKRTKTPVRALLENDEAPPQGLSGDYYIYKGRASDVSKLLLELGLKDRFPNSQEDGTACGDGEEEGGRAQRNKVWQKGRLYSEMGLWKI